MKKHTKPNPQMGITGGIVEKKLQLIFQISQYGIQKQRKQIGLVI
ncbi:MAG: hypothetical protein CM15mP127_07310 [Gammaproteobacteria bacterium]|nr:MAG: hypothetical protein CM15mP127_07310 [Gammaproteobacteria bacterium]